MAANIRTSQLEAPEEILRRLAREKREAAATVSEEGKPLEQIARERGRDIALTWLLGEGDRIRAEHTTNLAAVLKRLITRYLEYVLSVARAGVLKGLPVQIAGIPLAAGIVGTANLIREVSENATLSPRHVTSVLQDDGPLSPPTQRSRIVGFSTPRDLDQPERVLSPRVIVTPPANSSATIELGIREANKLFHSSRRETLRTFARCLKSCLTKAIDRLPQVEQTATQDSLKALSQITVVQPGPK